MRPLRPRLKLEPVLIARACLTVNSSRFQTKELRRGKGKGERDTLGLLWVSQIIPKGERETGTYCRC